MQVVFDFVEGLIGDEEFEYIIYATPDDLLEKMNLTYIGGKKADRLIRKILLEGSGESRKVLKERIKTVFMIENARKHPHWIQEPEWPFYDDRPMRFVSEERNGELFTYYFVDDITNARVIVEQYA